MDHSNFYVAFGPKKSFQRIVCSLLVAGIKILLPYIFLEILTSLSPTWCIAVAVDTSGHRRKLIEDCSARHSFICEKGTYHMTSCLGVKFHHAIKSVNH